MYKRLLVLLCLITSGTSVATAAIPTINPAPPPCTVGWNEYVESVVTSGDGQGHGPDTGSAEWQSVIEFRLGVRGNPEVPDRDSDAWCEYIDQQVAAKLSTSRSHAATGVTNSMPGPSFDCTAVETGSIAALVCGDAQLAALDRTLADVYAAASAKATDEQPPVLQAEQRGWIKGRDDCWKSADQRECIADEYTQRIAELQARYRLVAANGPVRYSCNGNPADEVIATYFQTNPPTLIAERGDSVSLMFQQRSASGAKYQGRNESLWEHHGEATVTWGYGTPEMRCVKVADR